MAYNGQLSLEEMVIVIDALDAQYEIDVHLEGGEALLSEDLPQLLARIPERVWEKITVTTSGALKLKFKAHLLRQVGDLRVSVEGAGAEHYAMRGIQLSSLEAFMVELKAEDVRFSIRSTLFAQNVRAWPKMVQYALRVGASRLSCYELQPVGRANETAAEYFLSPSDVDEFINSLLDSECSGLPLRCVFQFSERRCAAIQRRAEVLDAAGWNVQMLADIPSLTINANGEIGISPWKITARQVNDRIGNVRDPSWLTMLRKAYRNGVLHDDSASTSRIRISSKMHHVNT